MLLAHAQLMHGRSLERAFEDSGMLPQRQLALCSALGAPLLAALPAHTPMQLCGRRQVSSCWLLRMLHNKHF